MTLDLSKMSVSRDRLTWSDLERRLTPKSPISLPEMSNNRKRLNSPSSLIKSFNDDFNLQSINHRYSRVDVLSISHFVNEWITLNMSLLWKKLEKVKFFCLKDNINWQNKQNSLLIYLKTRWIWEYKFSFYLRFFGNR